MTTSESKIQSVLRSDWAIVVTTIASLIGVYTFIIVPIADMKVNQAVMTNKLDTLIAWSKEHDDSTVSMKQELNKVFADIYTKLGSKYIEK